MKERDQLSLGPQPAELCQTSVLRSDEGDRFLDAAAEFRRRTVSGTAKLTYGAGDSSSFRSTRLDADDVADGRWTGLNHGAEREQPQIQVENRGAVDRRDLADRVRGVLEMLRFQEGIDGVGVREQAIQGVTQAAKGRRTLIRRRIA